jgi:hypothetical protein
MNRSSLAVDRGAADDAVRLQVVQRPIAGVWVWQGNRRGGRLGWRRRPLALVMGIGFALPYLLLLAPIRAGLVMAGWRRLR